MGGDGVKASLQVRHWVRETDYPLVCEWWAGHGVPAPASARLPDCGLVAELGGAPVAAAWLYQDNSCGCAWLAHFVSRPGCKVREAHRGMELILGAADEVARELGRHTMVAAVASVGLGRLLARKGWEPEKWNRHYWRVF
jgi:hypothetical protein